MDRRQTDDESHAHMRSGDEFARLHMRMDDTDKHVAELSRAKADIMQAMSGLAQGQKNLAAAQADFIAAQKELADAVKKLTDETAASREISGDIKGTMRMLGRVNEVTGLLWKPLLFIAVAGGMVWVWATGGKVP